MKKPWVLFMVLLLTAMVGFACGGDEATPTTRPTTRPPTATSPKPTVTSPAVEEPTATSPATGGGVTLDIGSASSDQLLFNKDSLSAPAGSAVTLTFANNATTQQHNWVLVEDGTKDDVATAGLLAGAGNGWVPQDDARVIANTSLLNHGESQTITFTAPAAGTYQFVCTFPGHNLTMFGAFEVTP
ncbi:MAG: hypothetical protein HYX93_00250 [Chloroflexi bacterium]|nr:hypothetical protein [Chloroflexota bacterium]